MSTITTPFTIPGVYRQEVFPKPSPVLPTGVPVFLGFRKKQTEEKFNAAEKGLGFKFNAPTRLTNWPQFAEKLSDHFLSPLLAAAVHGFFANGGTLCFVVIGAIISKDQLEVAVQGGLDVADEITDSDLLCAPDLTDWAAGERVQRSQQIILDHCDRTNDRFALLDAPLVINPSQINQMHGQGLKGRNGALYGPWVKPERSSDWVPPCGHVAGMIARCDRATGVHRAPANLVIDDALDLSVGLSDADQPGGVNCLRSLTGRGIRVWGARTLSTDPLGRYVSERRLLITVGRWAALTLADVAFEPNDFALWVRIEREFTIYLTGLAQQGALQGQTAEEAFFVKCDAETNSPEVRDLGQVVTLVGLAPAVPGEFIVVRLLHGDTGVTLTNS